jgi:uncharacterized membrane protein YphA (DoxX/SURF4 family)
MSLTARILNLAAHPVPALLLRLYIAGLFVYAGMYKINYAAEFAETIASYRMVPYWAVNFLAVTMPWIELVCGILLACGIRVRSSVTLAGSFLTLFTVGIAVNLIRNSPISCGCFHSLGDTISWKTLLRDLVWVAMTAHVYRFDTLFRLERKLGELFREE